MRLFRRFSIGSPLVLSSLAVGLMATTAMPARAQGTTAQGAPTFTAAQFGALRWLSGDWRGHMPDGNAFHERYRFANDSTIVVTYFESDSTFARATRTDTIALRKGAVHTGSSTLTNITDGGVSFVNAANAQSGYDFARLPGGSWTATIRYTKDGQPGKVVYHMQRIR